METLAPTSKITSIDFEWRRLRQLETKVFDDHLIPYLTHTLPKRVLETAIADLACSISEDLVDTINMDWLFEQFTIPWSLFNWVSSKRLRINQFNPDLTVSENYLLIHGEKLNKQEKRFITEMNRSFYSFYSVLNVEKDQSLKVKDILLGASHTVKERQATHTLKRGTILFGRLLTLDKQTIFIGLAPVTIPSDFHSELLNFKDWLMKENQRKPLSQKALRHTFRLDLLDCFFDILSVAYNRPKPTLVNTDNELLQLSTSYFKLSLSPEETLKKLLPMTLSENPDEFLDEAKKTKEGKIQSIQCTWLTAGNKKHQSWETTVHGHIVIEKNKLTLAANSIERTDRGKTLLKKYLGNAISFQQTHIESPEQKMKSAPQVGHNKNEQEELLKLPEVQEKIKEMAKAHWDNWFDQSIPMLDDKTPRQAAKTKKGRERLDALFMHYEVTDKEKSNNLFSADVNYLKLHLGLE